MSSQPIPPFPGRATSMPSTGAARTSPNAPLTYHNIIPKLGPAYTNDVYPSLLPAHGGRPGLTYLQCPVEFKRVAQDQGWGGVVDTKVYTIVGPLGSVDCELLCRGNVIAGPSPLANKRKMFIHPMIGEITGLDLQSGLPITKANVEEPVKPNIDKSKNPKGS